jgi:phage FluMu protein Com
MIRSVSCATCGKSVERANFRPDAQCFNCKRLKKQQRAKARFQLIKQFNKEHEEQLP